MADYNSKYTGEQVEQLLDQVANGEVGGDTLTEAEIAAMGFTKNEGTITEVKMNGVSKGTSGVVDLGTVITAHQDISGKVDKVTGKGLSTEDFTTALKTKLEGLTNYDDTAINEAVGGLQHSLNTLLNSNPNDAINSFNEIIAFLDGVKDTSDLSGIIASIEQQIAGKMDKVTLASVATTGSYNDLINKPTIPNYDSILDMGFLTEENVAVVATSGSYKHLSDKPDIPTESTVSGWGFTKNTGTYSKPSGGIPKSDLSSDVQTSLDRANSAVQISKFGDIEYIQIQGFEGTYAGKLYALPNEATGDEDDILLSKNTVKTFNGESIFGSGDITVSGGGSSSGSGKEYIVVEPDLSPAGSEAYIHNIVPNTTYLVSEAVSLLHINNFSISDALSDEYNVIFKADIGETILSIIYPYGSIYWANGVIPTIDGGAVYELSIQRVRLGAQDFFNAVLTPFKLIE